MKFLRLRRGIIAASILVLALFLARPGAQWLKSRIVTSISSAISRPVDISSVSLRFLPRPGFELDNFVVYDSPEFSAEPMVRAAQVTALLRLRSLLRGRLEISQLSLDDPSLNLVRNQSGHWNLENLLQRAAQNPVAPTEKPRGEPRPAFPYIEASSGRINFKLGQEKKSFALTDADFSLWQDSENSWGMRLEATPFRTDFNLTNTGMLRIRGTWSRSATLQGTPLHFNAQWESGQLGEATKLVFGNDKGWRGGLDFSMELTGTPADLALQGSATVQDFHRYDNLNGQMVRLAAQCGAHYSSQQEVFSGLSCNAPVGEGDIQLTGYIQKITASREYALKAVLHKVPVQSVVAFARSIRQSIPEQLQANGVIDSHISLSRNDLDSGPSLQGSGEVSNFRLSGLGDAPINLPRIPLAIPSSLPGERNIGVAADAPAIAIGPINVALGRAKPAVVSGLISRSGYSLQLQGDAQVQSLLRMARSGGIGTPQTSADGHAKVDLQIAQLWDERVLPRPVGKVQLRGVQAEMRGVSAPLEITSANVILKPEEIDVRDISAVVAKTNWRGSLSLPRPCIAPANCPFHFDLRADKLDAAGLDRLLDPNRVNRPWYSFLTRQSHSQTFLTAMHASGKLVAKQITMGGINGSHFSGNIEVKAGDIHARNVQGDLLGGRYAGNWTIQLGAAPRALHGEGTLDHVDLTQIAEALHDNWVSGTASAKYQVSASSQSIAQLLSSTVAKFEIKATDGLLPHIFLAVPGPARMRKFDGQLTYHNGSFNLQNGKLDTPAGVYEVSGTSTMASGLNLKLTREHGTGFRITGTLGNPHIAELEAPPARVALKR